MRLTLHTDYGLRVLMALALAPERQQTIAELAARYRISRHHLMKVVMNLARAGFVEASRGRAGGLRLARPAGAITLGEVLRAMEDNLNLVECFDRAANTCTVSPACRLKAVLHEALAAFLGRLDRCTLAELVQEPSTAKHLRLLLGRIPITVQSGRRARVRPAAAAAGRA